MATPDFNATLATAILAVYMVIVVVIGVAGWRVLPSTDLESYVLANRGVGWFVGYFSTAGSQLSALTMMGFIAFYYQFGVSAYLAILVAYGIFTCGLYYFLGPRVWKLGRKFGHITPSDLAREYYDSKWMGYIVAVGMILALIPYLQVQFTGVGIIIQLATGGQVPVQVGAIIIAVIIAFYTLLGGMKSVAWVDAIQGLMLLIGGFVGGLILLYTVGGGFNTAANTVVAQNAGLFDIGVQGPFGWIFVMTFGAVVFLGWVFHPHMWIRIHYFESGRAVENLPWVALSIFWFTQIGGMAAVLTGAITMPDAPPDQFMMLIFRENFPTVIFAAFASALLAAMMSSASSQCHGVGAVASRDLSEQLLPEKSGDFHLTVARVATLVAIGLAVALSFAGIPFLLTSGAAAAALATSLFFPQAVAAVRGGAWFTRSGALAGSILGSVLGLGFILGVIPNPVASVYPGFWGLVVNVVAFTAVSAVTSDTPDEGLLREYAAVFEQPFRKLDEEHRDQLVLDDD